MKFFSIALSFLILICFSQNALAYSQDDLSDCISSAKSNPNIGTIPESSLQNYCDCALKLIVDEGKEIRESGYECASKHLG